MNFTHIKRINTTKSSIFYSLLVYESQLIGFGRQHYTNRTIKPIKLTNDFEITEDTEVTLFRGEDPRCVEHKSRLYILDNYLNDMYLIDYETGEYIKIDIAGKNISFISHADCLYFIHYIKPFELYSFDIKTRAIVKIETEDDNNAYNYEYRGGTPGYILNENGEYYGLGHRTYITLPDNITKHDIFKWIVTFRPEGKPSIQIVEVEQPANSQNICDPTSIIHINDKRYVITAESETPWFCDQDYITNIYEIHE